MARLGDGTPVRKIGMNYRSVTGRVALSHGGSVPFESTLERDWLISLDFDPQVVTVQGQPLKIEYESTDRQRTYTPDVMAEFRDRSGQTRTVVYEVKYREDLWSQWEDLKPKFRAAVRHCRSQGWKFKIVTETEIRTPLLSNAQFLRRYQQLAEKPAVEKELLITLRALGETTPQALLEATYWSDGTRAEALPFLWKLVASRAISTTMHEPLTMASPIWLGGDAS